MKMKMVYIIRSSIRKFKLKFAINPWQKGWAYFPLGPRMDFK